MKTLQRLLTRDRPLLTTICRFVRCRSNREAESCSYNYTRTEHPSSEMPIYTTPHSFEGHTFAIWHGVEDGIDGIRARDESLWRESEHPSNTETAPRRPLWSLNLMAADHQISIVWLT